MCDQLLQSGEILIGRLGMNSKLRWDLLSNMATNKFKVCAALISDANKAIISKVKVRAKVISVAMIEARSSKGHGHRLQHLHSSYCKIHSKDAIYFSINY